MITNNTPIFITFLLYIVVIYLIGYVANKLTKNLSDYVLGGRSLSAPIAALGVGASDMSGWLLLALPGAVYLNGVNQMWLPIGLTLGAYLNWRFVAKKLRIATEKANNALTIPAYFHYCFKGNSNLLRTVTAFVIIFFFTFYAGAGFVSGALLTKTTFHLSYHESLIISSVIIILYTCIGGFLAVNWIDFFQGSLMFFALIIVPIMTFYHIDFHKLTAIALQHPGYYNLFSGKSLISIFSLLAWGLGYFGQPHILVRFMAISNPEDVKISRIICMTWMVVALCGAVLTGMFGNIYFHKALAEPESVFLKLSIQLFNPWLTGILMAAVLSAVMSTVSAQLLASASSFVEDFYHTYIKQSASDKTLLSISRLSVLLIACLAVALAYDPHSSILQLVGYAWSGLGAAFGPLILLSLYWVNDKRKISSTAAVYGILASTITVVIWPIMGHEWGGIFKLYNIVPGFVMNVVFTVGYERFCSSAGFNRAALVEMD